jgi:hypothetical protein
VDAAQALMVTTSKVVTYLRTLDKWRWVRLAFPGQTVCLPYSRLLDSVTCMRGIKCGEQSKEGICLLILEGEEVGKRISTSLAGISALNPDYQLAPGLAPGLGLSSPLFFFLNKREGVIWRICFSMTFFLIRRALRVQMGSHEPSRKRVGGRVRIGKELGER